MLYPISHLALRSVDDCRCRCRTNFKRASSVMSMCEEEVFHEVQEAPEKCDERLLELGKSDFELFGTLNVLEKELFRGISGHFELHLVAERLLEAIFYSHGCGREVPRATAALGGFTWRFGRFDVVFCGHDAAELRLESHRKS